MNISRLKEWRSLGASLLLAALALSGCGLTPEAKESRALEAGRKYMAKHDYSRAAIEFQNAIRARKADPEPYYQLSLVYVAMGDYRSGIPLLRKALELNPKLVPAQVKMAELLASANSKEFIQQGEKQARDVLETNPNNADALNALAIAEWKLGQERNAELDLMRALSRSPKNLQASLNLAQIKFMQKDIPGAEEVIKSAVAASPTSAAPVLALGEVFLIKGNAEAAEQQYRRALQLEPANDLALLSLAGLYVRTNRMDLAEQTYRKIAALPDPKYKPAHAIFLFQSGKHEQAVAELENLVKPNPSDRLLRTPLVETYFAMDRLPDAQKLLTSALQNNGKDVDALMQRSRIYLAAGNHADAQKDIAQVLRLQPDSATAHYVMARVYEVRGETSSSRQELAEALRLNKFLMPARLDLSQALMRNNNVKSALQILNEAPEAQRKQLPLIVARNWALWSSGDMAELRKGVDEGLLMARTPDLLIQDALWKLRQGKAEEARAELDEALKINPGDLRALQALSRSYPPKQAALAVERVREYAARQPKSAPIQDFLGVLLLAQGDRRQARVAFEAARAADPKYVLASLTLVQSDVLDGRMDDAQRTLEGVLNSDRDNTLARLWLGHVYLMRSNPSAALIQYRQVVAADPNNAQALNNLAYLVTELNKQPSEALKYAQKAKELAPESGEYSDTLGWVLYRQGLYPLAVHELERATAKNDDVLWKYHLAMAYAKVGDLSHGRATLQAAMKQNPNLQEAKLAREMLGSPEKPVGSAR